VTPLGPGVPTLGPCCFSSMPVPEGKPGRETALSRLVLLGSIRAAYD